ncbi:NAD-dependent protein deacylase [Salinisphaera sp. SPP-AMP-43]|uniref:NAD-dependent protein deacylase n=1 Tax=Salinisphaera sp. SPP-AMP-43 TaxID=3121288 RepID=UPI003C6E4E35
MTADTALDPQTIATAARLIADRQRLLVLTGAGISAESGIPTFRQAQTGLWARYAPEDLATPEAFAAHPERVWSWYQWRRTLIARGGINAGHRAIAGFEPRFEVTVATQNVDGLHAAAGSTRVAELHGSIWRERCSRCDTTLEVPVAEPADETPGYCAVCGAMSRPDVVWFGERLPAQAVETADAALARAEAVIVVGTSNRVYPAAALVDAAVASSAPVIEINPEATPVSGTVDCRLAATASTALPAIANALDGASAGRYDQ